MALASIADSTAEWAGLPMPLDGHRLIIEPTFPKADKLMQIGLAAKEACESVTADEGYRLRNSWFSRRRQGDILIMERVSDGKIDWGFRPGVHHIGHVLETIGASDAWGIEQEAAAIQTLAGLVKHRAFKHYMLTGAFLETSKRSGLTYVFRRLRPTVVLSPRGKGESMRILACLCQHPIGYYADSFAGAMCPTDDVIAHLMQMRADEHLYWRRSNQHPPFRPEAAL